MLAWEAANGIAGSEGTYEYFVDRVATITRDQQRTPVQWVEVFEHFGRYMPLMNDEKSMSIAFAFAFVVTCGVLMD